MMFTPRKIVFLCNNATTSNYFQVEAAITSYLEKIVSFLVCLQENQEKRFPSPLLILIEDYTLNSLVYLGVLHYL